MAKFNTRIASILLAIGFFVSCSTINFLQDNKLSERSFTEEELITGIEELNEKIADPPASAEVFYKKGYLLFRLTKKKKYPKQRRVLYEQMHSSLEKAEQLYDVVDNTSGIAKTNKLLNMAWSGEHNRGVQIIQQKNEPDKNDFIEAAAHFHNATIILPDSMASYNMESKMYYKARQYDKAINALVNAQTAVNELSPDMWTRLGFLYMQTSEPRKAIRAYKEAKKEGNESAVLHDLTNAYIVVKNHGKAIELLDILIRENPGNPLLHLTLGQELYLMGKNYLTDFAGVLQTNKEKAVFYGEKAEKYFQKARKQFEIVLNGNMQNEQTFRTIAGIYFNIAAQYQKLLPNISDRYEPEIKPQIANYLSSAIPLYKKLTEISPQNRTYRTQLYHIYRYLGMEYKARRIKASIN